MESPQTSNKKNSEGDTCHTKVECTPKNRRRSGIPGEEFGLYKLHRESSPNFRAGQDVLEVGWGDSPEPLNVEQKFELNRTPVNCKKKLEPKESPKSSIPLKRRNVRSTFSIPSKTVIDVSKYVAEVQELSKTILKEFNSPKTDDNGESTDKDEKLVCSNNKLIENNVVPSSNSVCGGNENTSVVVKSSEKADPTFDSVLENFINEEDDWLSQALVLQEQTRTPHKGNFVKSKSENELKVPPAAGDLGKTYLTQNCRNINNNNFRRTASFDLTKPQENYSTSDSNKNVSSYQYTLQEIERKRLEAKYRRERREIERKKLEALRKLEMKKLRVIKA